MFEYVEGETLKERIRRIGRLPIAEAVAYAIEIARALGAAHARHIVHRDVKPQNVLIDEEGSAKVTDFGIARTLDEEGLTADGRVLGTTDYVSPEQALGQPVTGQSDLYSLGVVLYEMLTGEVPFKGESQVAVAMKHVREELPDVQAKRPEVSAALAAVVDTRDRQAPRGPLRQRRRVDRRPRGRARDRDRARRQRHRRGHDRPAHAARRARSAACRSGSGTGPSRWRSGAGAGRGRRRRGLARHARPPWHGKLSDTAPAPLADPGAALLRPARTASTRWRNATDENPRTPGWRSTTSRTPSGTPRSTTTASSTSRAPGSTSTQARHRRPRAS